MTTLWTGNDCKCIIKDVDAAHGKHVCGRVLQNNPPLTLHCKT